MKSGRRKEPFIENPATHPRRQVCLRVAARFLGIDGHEKEAAVIAAITPEKRATYERMASLEGEIALWQAGLAPKPTGVLIDMERDTKRRRAWR